eukprot:6177014-Pleurochrysis_carterae.AAC.2
MADIVTLFVQRSEMPADTRGTLVIFTFLTCQDSRDSASEGGLMFDPSNHVKQVKSKNFELLLEPACWFFASAVWARQHHPHGGC